MRTIVTGLLAIGIVAAGCGAGEDGGEPAPGGEKEDRPTAAAADRGEITIGTSRRARFTEPGQSHRFLLEVAAGASIRLDAMPSQANEDTLKTTLALFGPVASDGTLPRAPIASVDDGTFGIREGLDTAGEYVVVVGTAKRSMTGTYDLYAACLNRACHPRPVTLRPLDVSAELRAAAEAVTCENISWCSADALAFTYDEASPDSAALVEAILAGATREDAEWGTLEPRDDLSTLGADERLTMTGFVAAARDLAGAREAQAFHVDGVVMFSVDDSGTDGWDEELFVLHFPAARTLVGMYVRK
jgi:hypothetical protein